MNAMKIIADIFSSEAERQQMSGDLVTEVRCAASFCQSPFEVRDDEDMQKLVDSISGVTNLTVRSPRRGWLKSSPTPALPSWKGWTKIKVQVRDVDDDQAIIDMVDANIQREHISPMEKARALKMKNEALKRSAGRPKGGAVFSKPRTKEILAEGTGKVEAGTAIYPS